ncbi:multicopper oxidase family protein [Nesterenkonia natronophila]|uniref:Multicopper oxidase family protein n=1 Tax=Nesterenkonia natronophila TaxID=2174932 RepID=A0A3A4F292_9MICC|nr:multicopper oxidase family protein [Nesterenkonia natronophila]RJN32173.1 multicopper oxidase family protein [Nesterenkonia natronophila]
MRPISRREALGLAGLGGLSVVVGGVGLSRSQPPWRGLADGRDDTLVEPEVLRSREGRLSVELVADHREVRIAGRRARLLTYNSSVPGQTWRVRPGDRIEVRLLNELDTPTNLHTHGLEVSPRDDGDNPFLSIEPGQSFDYRFDLPEDHPPGVFWYHPHRHGTVADQLFGGLYGAIIVDGDEVPVSRERMLVVSDLSLDEDGQVAPVSASEVMMGREGDLLLINGQHQPQLAARPGQRERWRVINACTSRYLRLAVSGQLMELLGIDRSQEAAPREVEEVTLAPGNRADLLVTMRAGTTQLRTLSYDRGGMGGMGGMGRMGRMGGGGLSEAATLASLTVTGDTATAAPPVPDRPPVPDLRDQPVAVQREITFTMSMGAMMSPRRSMMDLGFDGRSFDPDRIDQEVSLGTVEEWVISNPTPMDHPFHLHVWPMQLIERAGQSVNDPTWRDVVNVPAQGRVRVLVDFARHPGRSVYHCHILDHEDSGMMASVEVS